MFDFPSTRNETRPRSPTEYVELIDILHGKKCALETANWCSRTMAEQLQHNLFFSHHIGDKVPRM